MRLSKRWHLGLLPIVAACGITDVEESSLNLDEEIGEPFVETLDAAGLQAIVEAADADFEVTFDEDLTALQVSVFTETALRDERLQGRVAAIDEEHSSIVLQAGDLMASWNGQTRFWIGEEPVSYAVFAAKVREELAAGRNAPVFAERPAREAAQGPDDASFVADEFVLGGDGTPSLRVRVGRGNLEPDAGPAAVSSLSGVASMSGSRPDAWLRVLGRAVRILVREGITHAVCHRHHYDRVVDVRGQVASIDLDRRKLTLSDGRVVRITARTDFVRKQGYARSLRAAAEAMASGNGVHARVLGVVERESRMLALWIALEIVPAEEEPVVMEFEGVVTAAHTAEGATVLSLADGSSVRLGAGTEVVAADADSPSSAEELMLVLDEGREVVARGTGRVASEGPLVLDGVRVVLEAEAPAGEVPTIVGIADNVAADGSVMLLDGTRVVVTSATTVMGADADSPANAGELMAMLDLDRRVEVLVFGTVDGPTQVTAARLVLRAVVRTFDVDVVSIDFDFGRLFFEGGAEGQLTESTTITAVGDGPTDLAGVDEVLAAGDRVRARGRGFLMGRAPIPDASDTYQVIAVEFDRIAP
jgi:hypothetical protein